MSAVRLAPRAFARVQQLRAHFPVRPAALLLLLPLLSRPMSSDAHAAGAGAGAGSSAPAASAPFPQSDGEWRSKLTPAEYSVLRLKDTERAGNGGYTKEKAEGVYHCKGCDAPLYSSSTKFDSGCGWPAFWDGLNGAIREVPDADGRRVEIVCARCDSHLGHVFRGERFGNPKDERHCVNSICLKLNKK